ncbi:unnamed protein product [Lampetra fluviatilis]
MGHAGREQCLVLRPSQPSLQGLWLIRVTTTSSKYQHCKQHQQHCLQQQYQHCLQQQQQYQHCQQQQQQYQHCLQQQQYQH